MKDINGGAPGGSALLNSNPEVGGNPVIECGQQYHQALAGKGSNLTNQVCNLLGNGETAFTAVAAQTIAHEHSADSGKLHTHWKDGRYVLINCILCLILFLVLLDKATDSAP